jgi:hypothetical protein
VTPDHMATIRKTLGKAIADIPTAQDCAITDQSSILDVRSKNTRKKLRNAPHHVEIDVDALPVAFTGVAGDVSARRSAGRPSPNNSIRTIHAGTPAETALGAGLGRKELYE